MSVVIGRAEKICKISNDQLLSVTQFLNELLSCSLRQFTSACKDNRLRSYLIIAVFVYVYACEHACLCREALQRCLYSVMVVFSWVFLLFVSSSVCRSSGKYNHSLPLSAWNVFLSRAFQLLLLSLLRLINL